MFDQTERQMNDSDEPPSGDNQQNHLSVQEANEDKKTGLFGWVKRLVRPNDTNLRGSLEELIEESQRDQDDAPFESSEKQLLVNILRLRDLSAADISIPRADIEAIQLDASLSDIIEFMTTYPHNRIPVYGENLDDIVGMLHIKDILTAIHNMSDVPGDASFSVHQIMREVLFISPAIRVHDLLLEMREKRIHIAVVVDEYGGTDGIVTIEDVVESIIGEIDDIDEVEGEMLQRLDSRNLIANARTPIDDFEEECGPILTDEEREDDIDTLGGLVTYVAGHMPMRGELIRHQSGVMFEILAADPRRVILLKVHLPSIAEDNNAEKKKKISSSEADDKKYESNVHKFEVTPSELIKESQNDIAEPINEPKQTRQA